MLSPNKRSTLQMFTVHKMKFSIKGFFSKYHQIRIADLVTFTEEIRNGKFPFLCCGS